jgi:hypothetical protein
MRAVYQKGIIKDRRYLDWLREQPCLVTGWRAAPDDAVDPAHIGTAGKALKSDDEAIPLRHSVHVQCHEDGEISTLRELLPDTVLRTALRAYAHELYADYLKQRGRTHGG